MSTDTASLDTAGRAGLRVKTARDISATGDPTALDRYLLDASESNGLIAVVEHHLGPRVLAAPVHRHSREDEYSLVSGAGSGSSRTARRSLPGRANWCSNHAATGTPSGTPAPSRSGCWK